MGKALKNSCLKTTYQNWKYGPGESQDTSFLKMVDSKDLFEVAVRFRVKEVGTRVRELGNETGKNYGGYESLSNEIKKDGKLYAKYFGQDFMEKILDETTLPQIVSRYFEVYGVNKSKSKIREVEKKIEGSTDRFAGELLWHRVYHKLDEEGMSWSQLVSNSTIPKNWRSNRIFNPQAIESLDEVFGDSYFYNTFGGKSPYKIILWHDQVSKGNIPKYLKEIPTTRRMFNDWLIQKRSKMNGYTLPAVLLLNPLTSPQYRDFTEAYQIIYNKNLPGLPEILYKWGVRSSYPGSSESSPLSRLRKAYVQVGSPNYEHLPEIFKDVESN